MIFDQLDLTIVYSAYYHFLSSLTIFLLSPFKFHYRKRLSNQTEMNAVGLSNDGGVRQATIQDSSRPLERLQTSSFGETINNTAEKNFPQPSDYLNDVNHVNETAPKSSAELADYQSIEQNNSIPHSTDSQVQPCHNDSPFAGISLLVLKHQFKA